MTMTCAGGKATIALAQSRYVPVAARSAASAASAGEPWVVPVCVAYDAAGHARAQACTQLAAATGEIVLDRCPAWFAPAGDHGYYRAALPEAALAAIRDQAWPSLTTAERIAVYSDAAAHARTGAPSLRVMMKLSAKLRTDPDPQAFAVSLGDMWAYGGIGASGLPRFVEAVLPAELWPAARDKVRAAIEPTARKLGLASRPSDSFGAALERIDTVDAAVWSRTRVLDAEARKLAPEFRDLPTAIRGQVLALAVNADPAAADGLRAQLAGEADRVNRDAILSGLGSVHDPARHRAIADALLATDAISGEDLRGFLVAGDREARLANVAWVRANFDRVLARMPVVADDDFPLPLSLIYILTGTCDAATRDDTLAFVTAHLGSVAGAALVIRQATESNDQCIAQKRLLAPSLQAWLGRR